MSYVSGFCAAVPKANKQAYVAMARTVADFLKDKGATEIYECWSEHLPEGEITSFKKAVKCQDDEAVVFSWMVWPDKEAWQKAMEAWRNDMPKEVFENMPFDGKRLIFGDFEVLFSL